MRRTGMLRWRVDCSPSLPVATVEPVAGAGSANALLLATVGRRSSVANDRDTSAKSVGQAIV
jgi:hypothetical protein